MLACVLMLGACASAPRAARSWFDVRDYGATGVRGDDARPAIQRAIDACAAAGGGTVLFPPGEYTSGSIELASHVRVVVEGGATVYSAKGKDAFPTEALFHGIDLANVTLEGRGTIDGCAAYEWRENDIEDMYIYPNLVLMRAAGKSLRRPFPTKDSVGHLVRLVRELRGSSVPDAIGGLTKDGIIYLKLDDDRHLALPAERVLASNRSSSMGKPLRSRHLTIS